MEDVIQTGIGRVQGRRQGSTSATAATTASTGRPANSQSRGLTGASATINSDEGRINQFSTPIVLLATEATGLYH
jgi:hypothetical protein